MASRIEELTARIRAKLRELEDDRVDRERAARVVERRDARLEELVVELGRARKRVQRRRAIVAAIKVEMDQAEDGQKDAELQMRLDQVAGELEAAIRIRDRLLSRIDTLEDRRDEAQAELKKATDEFEDDRAALQRMRERRRRIQEQKAANQRPSPNFTYAEFDCNDGTPVPKESYPAIDHWCRVVGEPVRARFGPVHVNSGFRHRAYNARIGGEDNSVHIYDFPGRDYKAVAVDFSCAKGSPAEWFSFTAGKADGRGRYATFHHADNRNRIGWPDVTWSG